MKARNIIAIALITSVSWIGFSLADSQEKARELQKKGDILPLETIVQKARSVHPGKVLEVELEHEHGQYIYELEILDKNGHVMKMKYDAKTGKLLKSKKDD